jgi:uncharacterized membrane protein (DUF4010 family)
VLVAMLVAFLNAQTLITRKKIVLTTSVALLLTGLTGLLCGLGHTLTPVAVAILTVSLLSWKESLADFSHVLTEGELRAAILMSILAFVIYPALPEGFIDRWELVEPRTAWVTVIAIAGIGFANYILLKIYGPRGITLTGFLGGLVNSTVTVTELATRVRTNPGLLDVAFRGILLSTAAMFFRNGLLLGMLAPRALISSLLPLLLMLAVTGTAILLQKNKNPSPEKEASPLPLASPFSLGPTLKFGLLFLVFQAVGTLAQRATGHVGFFAVSLAGGMISSASAVASAAALASKGTISPWAAGTGAVMASLMSASINLPLISQLSKRRELVNRFSAVLVMIAIFGVVGAVIQLVLR